MSPSPVARRHPALRWLVPALGAGVAAVVAIQVVGSDPSVDSLPDTTAAALVTSLRAVTGDSGPGFSGTVVSTLALGDDDTDRGSSATDVATGPDGRTSDRSMISVTSLLVGTHTLQVWSAPGDRHRVDVLDDDSEIDLVQQGRSTWRWDVARRVAVHTVQPATAPAATETPAGGLAGTTAGAPTLLPSLAEIDSLTPGGLTARALSAAPGDTRIVLGALHEVAGRRAYELILTPRDGTSRVGAVHISVDGRTRLPLAVSVYSRGAVAPEVAVAFTSIRTTGPVGTVFRFTPPPDARVHQVSGVVSSPLGTGARAGTGHGHVAVFGSGWASVLGYHAPASARHRIADIRHAGTAQVAGRWGAGYLLESPLLSVLVVDDGRVYAGPVDPPALYATAAHSR